MMYVGFNLEGCSDYGCALDALRRLLGSLNELSAVVGPDPAWLISEFTGFHHRGIEWCHCPRWGTDSGPLARTVGRGDFMECAEFIDLDSPDTLQVCGRVDAGGPDDDLYCHWDAVNIACVPSSKVADLIGKPLFTLQREGGSFGNGIPVVGIGARVGLIAVLGNGASMFFPTEQAAEAALDMLRTRFPKVEHVLSSD